MSTMTLVSVNAAEADVVCWTPRRSLTITPPRRPAIITHDNLVVGVPAGKDGKA